MYYTTRPKYDTVTRASVFLSNFQQDKKKPWLLEPLHPWTMAWAWIRKWMIMDLIISSKSFSDFMDFNRSTINLIRSLKA